MPQPVCPAGPVSQLGHLGQHLHCRDDCLCLLHVGQWDRTPEANMAKQARQIAAAATRAIAHCTAAIGHTVPGTVLWRGIDGQWQ